ncbi:MAG: hypothetical protein KKE36_04500 [Actinobacteria bacterium]|nr:hypothetical protein [Actinomycetota bacterium]
MDEKSGPRKSRQVRREEAVAWWKKMSLITGKPISKREPPNPDARPGDDDYSRRFL